MVSGLISSTTLEFYTDCFDIRETIPVMHYTRLGSIDKLEPRQGYGQIFDARFSIGPAKLAALRSAYGIHKGAAFDLLIGKSRITRFV